MHHARVRSLIRYRIVVEQIVPDDQLTVTDKRSDLAGRYLYAATCEAAALVNFRREFSFARPEHFTVRIETFQEAFA